MGQVVDPPVGMPELKVGMKLVEAEPFLGVCCIDQYEQGDYGIQVHIGVKPLDKKLEGKAGTGMYHTYYTPSEVARSKCGYLMAGCGEVFPKGTPVGQGALLGTVAWWVRKDIEFGKNRDTGDVIKAGGVLIPVKKASDEEQARAGEVDVAAVKQEEDRPEWSDDEVEAVLAVIEGIEKRKVARAAGSSKLPGKLKQAIINGTAIKHLEDAGLLADVDGTYQRAAVVAAQ
jgi:hypothetical protein